MQCLRLYLPRPVLSNLVKFGGICRGGKVSTFQKLMHGVGEIVFVCACRLIIIIFLKVSIYYNIWIQNGGFGRSRKSISSVKRKVPIHLIFSFNGTNKFE